jgi:hypothetical protein
LLAELIGFVFSDPCLIEDARNACCARFFVDAVVDRVGVVDRVAPLR